MGLIDILTQYDAKKKAAHAAKTVKHGVRVPKNLPFPDLAVFLPESFLGQISGVAKAGKQAGEGGRTGSGEEVVRWPDTWFCTSSHRRGQRSLLCIPSSMLSDSWILLPTSLPKSLSDSVVIAASRSRWQGSERLGGIVILATASLPLLNSGYIQAPSIQIAPSH